MNCLMNCLIDDYCGKKEKEGDKKIDRARAGEMREMCTESIMYSTILHKSMETSTKDNLAEYVLARRRRRQRSVQQHVTRSQEEQGHRAFCVWTTQGREFGRQTGWCRCSAG
jgi:hypothetical protein